jgi:predicted translin family RNA/ssDNA-binding protein
MRLGDVLDELRWEALDALRIGDLVKAEGYFQRMEEIYHLVAMEDSGPLKEVRQRLDIACSIIEATRSEVMAEMGHKHLSGQLRNFTT